MVPHRYVKMGPIKVKKLILVADARVNQRGKMEMGGIILYLLPSAIQLACVNSLVFLKLKII
jgi:hypothetical protein